MPLPKADDIDPKFIRTIPDYSGEDQKQHGYTPLFREGLARGEIQLASLSGHALGGGPGDETMTDAPVAAEAWAAPLTKPLAALGKDHHNKEQARKIAEAAGIKPRQAEPVTASTPRVEETAQPVPETAPKKTEQAEPDRFRWDESGHHGPQKDYPSVEDAARGAVSHVKAVYDQFNDKSNSMKPDSKYDIYDNQPVGGWIVEAGKDDAGNPAYRVDERYNTGVAYGNTGSLLHTTPSGVAGIVVYAPVSQDVPDVSYSEVSRRNEGVPVIVGRPDGSVEIYTPSGLLTEEGTGHPERSSPDLPM